LRIDFEDTSQSLGASLRRVCAALDTDEVALGRLLALLGEQGLLLFVMFLMIPFLLPVSIPGVSTVFSLVVILVGLGVVGNRIPWLPERLMARKLATRTLLPALERGARLLDRIDAVITPRLLPLTHGTTINRLNGAALIVSGVLLLFPLGLVPFSNTLPGIAVLLLAAGMAQRDGVFVILGYLMVGVTVVYFALLAYAVFAVGARLGDLDALDRIIDTLLGR
jgi:hypothetical protein